MMERVTSAGKFFRLGQEKWYVKGFSYGPFATNRDGAALPEAEGMRTDFAHMRDLGANCIRVYFPPPLRVLDEALAHDLRVLIDVPWEKHRCFFEDWDAQQRARQSVGQTARELGNHPAVLAISVVNEIPVDVIRFYGHRRVERFVDELLDCVKQQAPECLSTFVNYPTTEFLAPTRGDFCCFNVYLHDERTLGAYLDRLQHIAGNRPLVLGEYGLDTIREGEVEQAEMLSKHLGRVFTHGLAGSFIFAYTDDWFTGGHQIDDWAFGVTTRDRSEKLSAIALRQVWNDVPHGLLTTANGKKQNPVPLVGKDQSPAFPFAGQDLGEGALDGEDASRLGSTPKTSLTNGESEQNDNDLQFTSDPPKVSVVVCSYNGGSTLHECLHSLMRLDYPDHEVILVDDGSTDNTREIAEQFPQVVYHWQENNGLSVARNVGADLATGQIVAYTDSDCVVDEHWLRYLVQSMQDQGVEAIGGPNITPDSDGWVAKCVAASPGNPSHVMLDDQCAEHVPGCNMAFRRSTLLGLGGFDPQFRQAGDDVDMCWRFLDAGYKIGYAPAAMVWHHRRATVAAYAKQQRGYGRSEAMVHFKHPRRFGIFGRNNWAGIIYGDGSVGLPLMPDRVYHGRFGSGLFQTIYRHNQYGAWACVMSLEWHLTAIFLLILALLAWPLAIISGAMWSLTIALAIRSAVQAPLPRDAPWWCRVLVAYLYILQPLIRGWYRMTHLLNNMKLPRQRIERGAKNGPTIGEGSIDKNSIDSVSGSDSTVKRICATVRDLYWQSDQNVGRDVFLPQLVKLAKAEGWKGDFDNAWTDWDIRLVGDRWHNLTIRTATEELGWPNRFTRARCTARLTPFSRVSLASCFLFSTVALITLKSWAIAVGVAFFVLTVSALNISRRRCLSAATDLVARAGQLSIGLAPVRDDDAMETSPETLNPLTPPLPRQNQELEVSKSVALDANNYSDM